MAHIHSPLAGASLALALIAGSCGSAEKPRPDAAIPDAGRAISYQRDVRPIFQRCVICHRASGVVEPNLIDPFDAERGPIDHENAWHVNHDSPLEVLVKPGDPDASFLIYKVSADPDPAAFDTANNGSPMPLQLARFSEAELADVERWIRDGATNDAFFKDKVAPLFGTEITQGRASGRCTFCHYPGSPTGLDILAVFDSSKGLVGAKSLLSSKLRVAPGSPEDSFLIEKLRAKPSAGEQMPLHYERLSEDEVETLREWIAAGAKQD
ncbi:MAG TPA: hypothetical protein VJR89_08305 [Polyangiales bacterium]|nr:hypothetical protein [Polyangiales bacterium]